MAKKKKKTFAVRFSREMKISVTGALSVEATDKDQAKEMVKDLVGDDSPGSAGSEISSYDTDTLLSQIYEAIRLGDFEGKLKIDGVDELD